MLKSVQCFVGFYMVGTNFFLIFELTLSFLDQSEAILFVWVEVSFDYTERSEEMSIWCDGPVN